MGKKTITTVYLKQNRQVLKAYPSHVTKKLQPNTEPLGPTLYI